MKGADRAARRGQGRALRAVVLDPVTAAAHCPTSSEQHTIRYGPELAWHSLVVGVWWMLREVEIIELRLRSVKLHEVERRVEIRLGVTKTDIRGSGCIRAFDCTCSTVLASTLCPNHVLAYAVQRRLNCGASSEDPLFATPTGAQPMKKATIHAWRSVVPAKMLRDDFGEPTTRELTGHSPRRVGAQLELDLWQVAYIGRWGSSSVEHYVAEAAAHRSAVFLFHSLNGTKSSFGQGS